MSRKFLVIGYRGVISYERECVCPSDVGKGKCGTQFDDAKNRMKNSCAFRWDIRLRPRTFRLRTYRLMDTYTYTVRIKLSQTLGLQNDVCSEIVCMGRYVWANIETDIIKFFFFEIMNLNICVCVCAPSCREKKLEIM